ncbi:hypothetical protein NEPAR05_0249 [Nematocida parisii]|nr:hypothetical protein NEPAR05_0249 [Nematocida parisii]
MEIFEENEVLELSEYHHNDKVISVVVHGRILFTATNCYIYAWLDKESTLLAMFRIPAGGLSTPISVESLLVDSSIHKSNWQVFSEYFTEVNQPAYLFISKGYYKIENLLLTKYVQNRFLPHCHTAEGPFAVEEDSVLYNYKTEKMPIVKISERDVCTKIKCMANELYLGMDSGHILKILAVKIDSPKNIQDSLQSKCNSYTYDSKNPTEDKFTSDHTHPAFSNHSTPSTVDIICKKEYSVKYSSIFTGPALPVLDFYVNPLIISYFGRKLYSVSIACTEKEQVLNLYCMHSLFIVFTPRSILLLNQSLHRLNRSRVWGEAISYIDRVFISQDTGILNEILVSFL